MKATLRGLLAAALLAASGGVSEAAPPTVTLFEVSDQGAANNLRDFTFEWSISVPSGCTVYWVEYGWASPDTQDTGDFRITYDATGPTQVTGGPTITALNGTGEWTFWIRYHYFDGDDDFVYDYTSVVVN